MGVGIKLIEGKNSELSKPVITNVTPTSLSGTAPLNCNKEIFSDPEDEGKAYEGTTISDGNGYFSFTKSEGVFGIDVTATVTDAAGNTSEFSISVPSIVVENQSNPFTSELYQNYPNPFDPSTTISDSIPSGGKVILSVFDIFGREIATLENEYIIAGKHEAKLDISTFRLEYISIRCSLVIQL